MKVSEAVPDSPSVTLASPMENDDELSSSVTVTDTLPEMEA